MKFTTTVFSAIVGLAIASPMNQGSASKEAMMLSTSASLPSGTAASVCLPGLSGLVATGAISQLMRE